MWLDFSEWLPNGHWKNVDVLFSVNDFLLRTLLYAHPQPFQQQLYIKKKPKQNNGYSKNINVIPHEHKIHTIHRYIIFILLYIVLKKNIWSKSVLSLMVTCHTATRVIHLATSITCLQLKRKQKYRCQRGATLFYNSWLTRVGKRKYRLVITS